MQSVSKTVLILVVFVSVGGFIEYRSHTRGTLFAQSSPSATERFVSLDEARFPCSAEGIAAAIQATIRSQNRSVDATACTGSLSISSNLWAGVENSGKIVFGSATFTVLTSQLIPSRWDVSGSGIQTVFQVASGTSLPNNAKNAIFVNAQEATYTPSAGHDSGISIHDMSLDGNSELNSGHADQGIVLAGANNSHLYNLHLKDFTNSCVDVRDGDDNIVESNWGINCGATPNQWHAFGGGTLLRNGLFRRNTFVGNHAAGGMGDHFDLFGQGSSGNCSNHQQTGPCSEQNVISGNTSEDAGTTCFFLDTTAHSIVSQNICRFPRENGIAITSGAGSQGAVHNIISSNVIISAGQNGMLIGNVSNDLIIQGNSVENPGKDGIHLQDVGGALVVANMISGPGQSAKRGQHIYSGIYIGSSHGSHTVAASNHIHGNLISDTGDRMRFGIYEAGPNDVKTASTGNSASGNRINCWSFTDCAASAGSTGAGIQDEGSSNVQFGNVWNGKRAKSIGP